MSHKYKKKIDWKSLVPKRINHSKKNSEIKEIKSYMQELAGHEILVSVICNQMQSSICQDFLNYLHRGDLFWFKQLKPATHVNLSFNNGKIQLLFKNGSGWKEVLIDLKKELDPKYQENIQ